MHVVARGALIGGTVGLALAAVRRGEPEGRARRCLKSVAEGALAGAAVGFLLDRQLRTRAAELVAEHGPELVDTVVDLATEALDAARPRLHELADLARERAEHLLATA